MAPLEMIAIGKKLSNIYQNLCAPVCRRHGVNQTGFDVLMFFANNPQYNTASDVCNIRGIKSGIASVAIDSLIKNGLLCRTEDEADRRKRRLAVTEKAAPIIEEGREMQAKFTAALRQNITDEEFKEIALENGIIDVEIERDVTDRCEDFCESVVNFAKALKESDLKYNKVNL